MTLSVEHLSVNFATAGGKLQAVRDVSFSLKDGEILGVVGESGSGKSVTAQAILRILPANGEIDGGTIRFDGQSVGAMSREELRSFRGRRVAMIFQEPGRSFDPIYSIGKSLAETIRAHEPNLTDQEVRERSVKLLEEVHVTNPASRLENFPHQFSGGLLQRIMIAHALASDPQVLIADEPTTALDVTIQAGIIELLRELRRRRNLAIVFITHNLALISSLADRLVVMYGGLVMEEGPTQEVLQSPHHPYTAGLLSSLVPFGLHHSERELFILGGSPPDPLHPEPGCPFAPRCPLVRDACRPAVPELSSAGDTQYRCVVSGPKGAQT
jgi:oligopeptide/dipeptide ABC transporter ATP-binding protein